MSPVYQYRCKCGKEFDSPPQTKFNDRLKAENATCKECGKVADIQVSAHAKTASQWEV